MPYRWASGFRRETTIGKQFESVALEGVVAGEILRRVILRWRLDLSQPTSAQLDSILRLGYLSLVEWTTGTNPATPMPTTQGLFDDRDILHSDYAFPGPAEQLVGRFGVPGYREVGEVDVEISRRPGTTNGAVWWNWGFPPPGDVAAAVAFSRVWWRVLVETPA